MIWDETRIDAYDVETYGHLREYALQPWRIPAGDMWCTHMAFIEHRSDELMESQSMLFPTKHHFRARLEKAVEDGAILLGWNVVFDIMVAIGMGCEDLVHKLQWLDGMLLWRHLEIEPEYEFQTARHKRKSYGLKTAVKEFLPIVGDYADDVDFGAVTVEELKKLAKYGNRDAVFTWVISRQIWHELKPKQQRAALIEAQSIPLVAAANYYGMTVDTLTCTELEAKLTRDADRLLGELEPHGVTEQVVRSPKQLEKVLFDEWGLPVLKTNTSKKTGNTSRSTDKEVLHELAFQDERVQKVRDYREALGNRSKFATGILTSVGYNGDGQTRPAARIFGTYSGRLTYASKQGRGKDEVPIGFALHQEKRDEEFRNVLIPPKGYTLVEFDAAGQEFRWMAIASNDPTMLSLCMPGEDPHSFMGAQIIGEDYTTMIEKVAAKDPAAKSGRQLGKVGNLSLQYRTSAPKLRTVARVQYGIPMEMPEAQRIRATYLNSYKQVPIYWEQQIAMTKVQGFVETYAGRRVKVVGDWNGDWGWSMGSTAINYRIQGTGADQKYLALMVIKSYLNEIGGYFAWDLHDGIYLYIPDGVVMQAVVRIKHMLDHLPYQQAWGFTPPIPLPWDCKLGKSWGGQREYKF